MHPIKKRQSSHCCSSCPKEMHSVPPWTSFYDSSCLRHLFMQTSMTLQASVSCFNTVPASIPCQDVTKEQDCLPTTSSKTPMSIGRLSDTRSQQSSNTKKSPRSPREVHTYSQCTRKKSILLAEKVFHKVPQSAIHEHQSDAIVTCPLVQDHLNVCVRQDTRIA